MTTRYRLFFALVLAVTGCDGGGDREDAGPDAGTQVDSDAGMTDAGTNPQTDAGPNPQTDAGMTDAGGTTGAWQLRSHSCPGINRTDALLVESDALWIGCGSGAEGRGLFRSEDGGATWAVPATTPSGVLDAFRVLSVHRGFGGLVYVAGEGPAGAMVISLDTSSEPYAAAAVLTRGTTIGRSFLASPFVTTPSGAAFADSFNGHDALYRADDTVGDEANMWTDASEWEDDGGRSHQIADMVTLGERFVGCGSTIAEPPLVYLPSMASGAEPWEMTPVQLVSGLGEWEGEMWGVAASADRVVVVGVDQDSNVGKIFVSGSDRYDGASYTQTDIDPLLPTRVGSTDSTWARGVCMEGDRVVVVGEVHPLGVGDNTGFVLESTDGGATFVDVTPEGSPDTWSKCHIEANGALVVAGAGAVGTSAAR